MTGRIQKSANRRTEDGVGEWLGFRRVPAWTKGRTFGGFVGFALSLLISVLFLLALIAAVRALWPTADAAETSLGVGALIVTILGAPLVIWRTVVAQQTVNLQKEGLMTDRISKAVEQLGAEKAVKRQRRNQADFLQYADGDDDKIDYKKPIYEEVTVPNIEVRIGGIYALERIAQDSMTYDKGRDHIHVMEILCTYVRENSPASAAAVHPYAPDALLWKDRTEDDERAYSFRRELPSHWANHNKVKLGAWISSLSTLRADIQTVLTVIGRRTSEQVAHERDFVRSHSIGYRLDLRNSNLQRADLRGLDFDHAHFAGSRMEGVDLRDAQVREADFYDVHLDGARMNGAQAEGSTFFCADLYGAYVSNANLRGCDLQTHRMFDAQMDGVDFGDSDMANAYLTRANICGAQMRDARNLRQSDIDGAYGDAATKLPDGLARPSHWETDMSLSDDYHARHGRYSTWLTRSAEGGNGA